MAWSDPRGIPRVPFGVTRSGSGEHSTNICPTQVAVPVPIPVPRGIQVAGFFVKGDPSFRVRSPKKYTLNLVAGERYGTGVSTEVVSRGVYFGLRDWSYGVTGYG